MVWSRVLVRTRFIGPDVQDAPWENRMPKKQKPHQRKELDAAVGQVLKVKPESHPRPVERATTRDAEGGGENKLHGPNIAGNEFRVKRRRDFGIRDLSTGSQ